MHFITFLRHGESEGNSSGLLQGQSDYPLTPVGVEQAQRLAHFWDSQGITFDLVISSPLARARRTAEIVAESLDVPLELDPAWMERSFGILQGASLRELARQVPPPDYFHPYDPIGGSGESQVELYTRACLALEKILRQPAGSYLVVSHGGILNKAIFVILGITPQGHYNSPIFHLGNTGYAQFRYNSDSRQWAVLSLNNDLTADPFDGPAAWKQD